MMEISHVCKARAKALGMVLRSRPNGPNALWVELEFMTAGELRRYNPVNSSHVELEIRGKERPLMSASLLEDRPSPGRVLVSFAADRAHLDQITLRIVVGSGPLPPRGYELRVKDFIQV